MAGQQILMNDEFRVNSIPGQNLALVSQIPTFLFIHWCALIIDTKYTPNRYQKLQCSSFRPLVWPGIRKDLLIGVMSPV